MAANVAPDCRCGEQVETWSVRSLVALGAVGRLLLVCYGRIHDYLFDLKFTDVDYRVYSDAARLVTFGGSPYNRPTYRYAPVLAHLLRPTVTWPDFGKLLFVVVDMLVAWLVYVIAAKRCERDRKRAATAMCLWLLNPLPAVVAARGNADCLVCAAVLATLFLLLRGNWLLAAVVHGAGAIHFKLYPAIYLPCVFVHLALAHMRDDLRRGGWRSPQVLVALVANWRGYVYVLVAVASFLATVHVNYTLYGEPFLNESLLYHVLRVDFRHNFSPYFYPLYLAHSVEPTSAGGQRPLTTVVGLCAFVPQVLCVALFAFRYRRDPPMAWLTSTLGFVAFNKVCTSQYFVWHLCLAPCVWPTLAGANGAGDRLLAAFGRWFGAQALWLALAYLFEFHGWPVLPLVWLASVLFLLVNVSLLGTFVRLHSDAEDDAVGNGREKEE